MPRFSLKRMFASTSLVAAGLAVVIEVYRSVWEGDPELADGLPLALWVGGGMMIGAGALVPIKITLCGMLIGLIVQLLLLVAANFYVWTKFI